MEQQSKRQKAQQSRQKYNRMVLIRVVVLMVCFGFLMFIPLGWQIYDIAILRHDELEQKAVEQQTDSKLITPNRGTIYDRNMNALAISATVETVSIAPYYIPDDEKARIIADGLSRILGVDRDLILEKAAKKSRKYELIKAKIEKAPADEVRAFITENELTRMINVTPDSKRYYPNGPLASTIIGFTGTENSGLMGLEAQKNKDLTGVAGQTIAAQDASGAPLPVQYEAYYDAQDGKDVITTIDQTIQHFLEKHLETAAIENEAAMRACGIVIDIKTGAILAMDTTGDFDLNDPYTITDEEAAALLESLTDEDEFKAMRSDLLNTQWRNKAISDTYEPGSVFKVVTAAMAIEEGAVDLVNDRFNCSGKVQVLNHTIHCHKRIGGHGSQTFLESLLHSCNPAFIQIGEKIGAETFYKYLQGFGFMERTGIDLNGEAGSIIGSWESFKGDKSAQAVYAFGQTFAITPIQMINAICAIANGGNLMQPYVVSQVLDSDGNVAQTYEPTVIRKVISESTSVIMREYMKQCVEQGTGSNAYVKGYRVAGKTGTSQKRDKDPTGELKLYVTSFAGFAPADDPQVAILIMIDEPGGPVNLRTGGYMAAPVAGRVLADILPYLGVVPIYSGAEESAKAETNVPYVQKMSVKDASEAVKRNDLTFQVVGTGETVTDQLPAPSALVPVGTVVMLYTEGSRPQDVVMMPNVKGMSPESANVALTNAGLIMRPLGAQEGGALSLAAGWQEYEPGTELPYGAVVSVEFRSDNVQDMDLG